MPARCEAAMPESKEKATIRVLRDTVKTQFWIAAGDVSWLVLYLADELVTQNVSRKKPAVAGEELKSNGTFPFLHVGVDLTSGSSCECTYVATFIDGPLKGEFRRTCLPMFDKKKWAECMKHPQRWDSTGVPFEDASDDERRRAMVYFLQATCASLMMNKLNMITVDPFGDAQGFSFSSISVLITP